jgi:hypothetical protein
MARHERSFLVMPGLVRASTYLEPPKEDVDGRDEPGHDGDCMTFLLN